MKLHPAEIAADMRRERAKKDNDMNGSYKVDGRMVRREPTKTETGFKMGFPICEVSEYLNEGAAQVIADALNLHREKYPEKH